MCVCVRERERERERRSHHSGVYSASEIILIVVCVLSHKSIITVSVMWLCSSFGLELRVKLRTLWTVFTFILKAEARNYGKGRYNSDAACGVWPIKMLWFSWPIRADCACQKEKLFRKQSIRERRGIVHTTIMYSIWKILSFLNIKTWQHILLHQIHKIMPFNHFKATGFLNFFKLSQLRTFYISQL